MVIEINTLIGLLIIAGIILVIYLIVAVYNLIKTLKKAQVVLEDFEVVSKVASKRSQQIDKAIDDMSQKVKSGKNIFQSLPVIISVITKIAGVVGQKNKKSE